MPLQNADIYPGCIPLLKDGEIVFDPAALPGFKVAGIKPIKHFVLLPPMDSAEYFLENREAGIINFGGKGLVGADGAIYEMDPLDCIYLGKGTTDVKFFSEDEQDPAMFLMISVKADFSYPNHLIEKTEAIAIETKKEGQGSLQVYIRPGGIQSCQLQMGIGPVSDSKDLKELLFLPASAHFLVYNFNATPPSFIWAGTSCD
jgi:4-deoxy-L-threo-5-hexosulose-uronate ketol-isomerase